MGGIVTPYLIVFNLASCLGWGYVLVHIVLGLIEGWSPEKLWAKVGLALCIVQTMASFEIFHAATKMVRSPVMTVFTQVNSRLLVLWVYLYWAKECQRHWSLYLMLGAWSSVEVPRYLFYALNLMPQFSGSKMPYPLFWLRYSLFIILYPAGISGEMIQAYIALTTLYTWETTFERLIFIIPILSYPPFGPYMIFNMWNIRKKQFKKRALEKSGPKKKKVEGLVWPITNDATGDRSTSVTNQAIWAAAVSGTDKIAGEKVRKVRNWRFGYAKHVEQQVRVALQSKQNALQIAKDGLKFAQESFEFVRNDKTLPFAQAMKEYTGSYDTGFIQGTGEKRKPECVVNYKGERLTGDKLRKQLDKWVEYGTIEPSCADSIGKCIDHPEWMDLSDRYFVLLGATSAMGPLDLLLECGANIIGIDLDRDFIWEKLINKARKSSGTLTFPLSRPQSTIKSDEELFKSSGANLLTHTPEIANWISTVCPGKPLTIGNYTYLDGALHVQLSLACDAIMEKVCSKRKDTSIAFLCTPTDCHNVSKEAHEACLKNYKNAPAWQKFLENSMGKNDMNTNVFKPVEKSGLYYHDGITVPQGPNYALAKRMQHWRVVIARENGHIVSSNVAPSTSTASVVSNKLFAAAYEGFKLFHALEVMKPETSSSAMLALLINDIRNPESVANPKVKLDNPMELFSYNAFHGGSFRCPYTIGSIGTVSVLYFFLTSYGIALVPIIGGLGYAGAFVVAGGPKGLYF